MTEAALRLLNMLSTPFSDPASRTFIPWLLVSAGIALVWAGLQKNRARSLFQMAFAPELWRHPSSRLDLQMLIARRLIQALWPATEVALTWTLAVNGVRWLDRVFGIPEAPDLPLLVITLAYTLALFVAWDLSRYVLHRLMHTIPALWSLHQVHHSAQVLTPLTFHRVHPMEGIFYGVRGLLVSGVLAAIAFWLYRGAAVEFTLMGVHAIGLFCTASTGNLRHSHLWIRFGPGVERWLISPAQHQMHHSTNPKLQGSNYGTWLAIWDRAMGSLVVAGERPPESFGLLPDDSNHTPDDLISALFRPMAEFFLELGKMGRYAFHRLRGLPPLRTLGIVLIGLATSSTGVAQETDTPDDDAEERPEDALLDENSDEFIVYAPKGIPWVAGSAHVISEEELERHQYDDIHQIVSRVPGVYVRSEDGFGLRPNLGIRGANSDRSAKITLLEDGIPLTPAPYAAPAAYYFPMAGRMVGVEVFKGPAAIRHGPQTVGGAINLLTRAVPEGPISQLDLAGGLYETLRAHGYAGVGNEHGGVLAEFSHLSSGGFKVLENGAPTGFDRQDVMLKGAWSVGGTTRHTLGLKLGYGREESNETYLGLSATDFAADPYQRYTASALDVMRWQRTQAEASWRVRAGALSMNTTVYHHFLTRAWTKLNRFAGGPALHDLLLNPDGGQAAVYAGILRGEEDSISADQVLQIGTNDRRFHSVGMQWLARHKMRSDEIANEFEVGVRLHADYVTRLHTEVPYNMLNGSLVPEGSEASTVLDSMTNAHALAIHAHNDFAWRRLHIVPGMRLETIWNAAGTSETGPTDPVLRVVPLPGLGLMGEPLPWLGVFGGVHRGFSPVGPGQDPEIQPESSWSYELGVRAVPGESHVELVGFLSDYTNLSGQCTLSGGCDQDQVDQQFNGGQAWVYGAEALASHRLRLRGGIDLYGEMTYTYTYTAFRTGFISGFAQFGTVSIGDALPYVPEHQGGLRLEASHRLGVLSIASHGRSAMRDVAGQGEIADDELIPGVIQLDAALRTNVTDRLTLYVNGTNLTGAKTIASWRPFGARPIAPRQVMGGIEVSL